MAGKSGGRSPGMAGQGEVSAKQRRDHLPRLRGCGGVVVESVAGEYSGIESGEAKTVTDFSQGERLQLAYLEAEFACVDLLLRREVRRWRLLGKIRMMTIVVVYYASRSDSTARSAIWCQLGTID